MRLIILKNYVSTALEDMIIASNRNYQCCLYKYLKSKR